MFNFDYICNELMKKIITYLLLLNFLVLITPRDIWHSCNDHSDHKEVSKELKIETATEADFCLACDYELGFIDQPNSISFKVQKQYFDVVDQVLFSRYRSNAFNNFSHRGPPVV